MNHTHRAGPRYRASELMVEGTQGAARLVLGVNLDYPTGLARHDGDRARTHLGQVPLRGSWFTEAFEGPMSNLQRFVAGEDPHLVSPVEDTIKTMALVEACYESSDRGGTPIPDARADDPSMTSSMRSMRTSISGTTTRRRTAGSTTRCRPSGATSSRKT